MGAYMGGVTGPVAPAESWLAPFPVTHLLKADYWLMIRLTHLYELGPPLMCHPPRKTS